MKGFIVWLSYYKDGQNIFTIQDIPGQSTFMTIFNDALDSLGNIYWILQEFPLSSNSARNEDEIEFFYSEVSDKLDDITVFEPFQLFPRLARWVRDDNTHLIGFFDYPSEEALTLFFSGYDDVQINELADIFFNNEDGATWECYTRNEEILNLCLESAQKSVDHDFIYVVDNLPERARHYPGLASLFSSDHHTD